jgi:hypothetical protein
LRILDLALSRRFLRVSGDAAMSARAAARRRHDDWAEAEALIRRFRELDLSDRERELVVHGDWAEVVMDGSGGALSSFDDTVAVALFLELLDELRARDDTHRRKQTLRRLFRVVPSASASSTRSVRPGLSAVPVDLPGAGVATTIKRETRR